MKQPTWSVVIGVIFGESSLAAACFCADYIAYRIGSIWLVLAGMLIVRAGRFVFPIAFLLDYLLNVRGGTTYVFTIVVLLVANAHPLVFNDLNMPIHEQWYRQKKRQQRALPLFLSVSGALHDFEGTKILVQSLWRTMAWFMPSLGFLSIVTWCLKAVGAYLFFTSLRSELGRPLFDLGARLVMHMLRAVGEVTYGAWQFVAQTSLMRRAWSWRGEKLVDILRGGGGAEYRHAPLEGPWDIRLIRLLPRGNSDVVRCEMVHINLAENNLAFEAMSYFWGKPERTRTIFINGLPFKTTENAYALLHDRSPIWTPRLIWIDSLCIDQDNVTEKSEQVQLMWYIYHDAGRVTSWLGNNPNADLAVDLLLELSYLIETEQPSDDQLYKRYQHERRSPRFLALTDLFANRYFTRIWMVQETAVNKNLHVVYGGHVLQWETLLRVITTTFLSSNFGTLLEDTAVRGQKRYSLLNGMHVMVFSTIRAATRADNPVEMHSLLRSCWTMSATDPRDKVYALTGIAKNGKDSAWLRPDYAMPTADVYQYAALYLASQPSSLLYLLSCAGTGWPRNLPDLPSWVPDWSAVGRSVIETVVEAEGDDRCIFFASGPLPNMVSVENREMQLSAIRFDTVIWLSSVLVRPETDENTLELNGGVGQVIQWYNEVEKMTRAVLGQDGKTPYPTGQPWEEVMWRTLIMDLPVEGHERLHRPAPASYAQYYRDFIDEIVDLDTPRYRPLEGEAATMARLQSGSTYITTMRYHCNSRRVGFTESGLMVVVPSGAKLGDVLVLIPSTGTPHVVRPAGVSLKGDPAYELVGDCYAHGVMDRERADPEAVERITLV